jgi:lysophospholipase L1-like esterase
MNQLPYDLCFCYRFNLHKLVGMNIDDTDLPSIARIFGAGLGEIEACERENQHLLDAAIEGMRSRKDLTVPEGPCTYLALGDSITSDRLSYAKIIKKIWNGIPGRSVIDAGISGDTTADIIDRFYEDVMNVDSSVVSIFIGTNDSRGLGDGSGITRVSVDEYGMKLDYLVRTLQTRENTIINITIPPVNNRRLKEFFGAESKWEYSADHLEAVNAVIRGVSEKYGTTLVDFAAALGEKGDDFLDTDGLHLNMRGQVLLAEMLFEVLP